MIDFIPVGERREHLVPQDEQDDHCPFDFCPCKPVYRYVNGVYLWIHKVSDERDLWEQAECIRQITSIGLWHQARASGAPYEIIKFPAGFQTPVMPPTAHR